MKKLLSLVLSLALVLGLFAACKKDDIPDGPASPPDGPAASASQVTPDESAPDGSEPGEDTRPEVNFAVISGPTGVGAAKLLFESDRRNTNNKYNYTVVGDNTEIVNLLTSGEADIAAVATNVAANLYNKTNGSVKMLAVNTLNVLYILEKGDSITSIADLEGKTIWTMGQGANPEYILTALLAENGLVNGENVTVEFLTPQEVTANMISSEDGICMLPVPAATALMLKDDSIREAVSVNDIWQSTFGTETPMGCIVVRTAYLENHPEEVLGFLADYEASVAYMTTPYSFVGEGEENPGALVAQYGITANETIAHEAIAKCNLTYLVGSAMQDALTPYFSLLYSANPDSIGGSIPDDGLYYVP